MAKMISMKRAKDDGRQEMTNAPIEAIAPDYPWGLCLHLEKPELGKLGMMGLPEVGAELQVTAKVKVTRVSASAVEGADEQNSVDLQITDLALGAPST